MSDYIECKKIKDHQMTKLNSVTFPSPPPPPPPITNSSLPLPTPATCLLQRERGKPVAQLTDSNILSRASSAKPTWGDLLFLFRLIPLCETCTSKSIVAKQHHELTAYILPSAKEDHARTAGWRLNPLKNNVGELRELYSEFIENKLWRSYLRKGILAK